MIGAPSQLLRFSPRSPDGAKRNPGTDFAMPRIPPLRGFIRATKKECEVNVVRMERSGIREGIS